MDQTIVTETETHPVREVVRDDSTNVNALAVLLAIILLLVIGFFLFRGRFSGNTTTNNNIRTQQTQPTAPTPITPSTSGTTSGSTNGSTGTTPAY